MHNMEKEKRKNNNNNKKNCAKVEPLTKISAPYVDHSLIDNPRAFTKKKNTYADKT